MSSVIARNLSDVAISSPWRLLRSARNNGAPELIEPLQ